ncbi:MAG: DUF6607 family protein [Myxococcota bacterium]
MVGPSGAEPETPKPYVFAWPFLSPETMQPRGGTSRGAEVTLALEPSEAWVRLRRPGLTPQERDRAAILALAGDYRTSFDFLETVLYEPDAKPARPYRSWGTERIYVLEDRPDFVILQHGMVMFVVDDEGERQGPLVQKHWRQDWRYEPSEVLAYRGFERWQLRPLPAAERRGVWSQTVYQVDDSPRYVSTGRWHHEGQAPFWSGSETWRPLPRREHTVRDDYQVLAGRNRLTVLPTGWVHEQDNRKLVVEEGRRVAGSRAREVGVNRYELLEDFDFSAGDAYWSATSPFWGRVRAGWAKRAASGKEIHVARQCDDEPAFVAFFRAADRLAAGEDFAEEAQQTEVDRILECLVSDG